MTEKDYFRDNGTESFNERNIRYIKAMSLDDEYRELCKKWCIKALDHEYTHHFRWLGRPIIQLPQDIIALQEIIWKIRPEMIVETGIARGGSLIFHASILELIGQGQVIGIDIALRQHNRDALRKHKLSKRIKIVDGSSIDPLVVKKVHDQVGSMKTMVILDSNHSHQHVKKELELYNDLVKKGSYLIVLDTWLEDFPPGYFSNRPWDKGNNPATAVAEFLEDNKRFKNDSNLVNKLAITCSSTGYLKCVADPK